MHNKPAVVLRAAPATAAALAGIFHIMFLTASSLLSMYVTFLMLSLLCHVSPQGKAVGEVFFTKCGQLILRSNTYPLLSKQHDYVVEDYLRLEDGGKVIVDRMCCYCTKTGRSAEQLQVVNKAQAQ